MKKNKEKYIIVRSDINFVEKTVSVRLKEGYVLAGNLQVITYGVRKYNSYEDVWHTEQIIECYQPMILKEK